MIGKIDENAYKEPNERNEELKNIGSDVDNDELNKKSGQDQNSGNSQDVKIEPGVAYDDQIDEA